MEDSRTALQSRSGDVEHGVERQDWLGHQGTMAAGSRGLGRSKVPEVVEEYVFCNVGCGSSCGGCVEGSLATSGPRGREVEKSRMGRPTMVEQSKAAEQQSRAGRGVGWW